MKKSVLAMIAKKMVLFDSSDSSFSEGAFFALSDLLERLGYTFKRDSNTFCIYDDFGVVCTVSR